MIVAYTRLSLVFQKAYLERSVFRSELGEGVPLLELHKERKIRICCRESVERRYSDNGVPKGINERRSKTRINSLKGRCNADANGYEERVSRGLRRPQRVVCCYARASVPVNVIG